MMTSSLTLRAVWHSISIAHGDADSMAAALWNSDGMPVAAYTTSAPTTMSKPAENSSCVAGSHVFQPGYTRCLMSPPGGDSSAMRQNGTGILQRIAQAVS